MLACKDEQDGATEMKVRDRETENRAVLVLLKAKLHPFNYHMSLLIKSLFCYGFEVGFLLLATRNRSQRTYTGASTKLYQLCLLHCKDCTGVGLVGANMKSSLG